mmetsp:Transcript_27252/g.41451  ORF Transcript_27252/g.41451 Transcript_27252/m.41451 type:complete len:84 (+) Transcript_27252:307-558(+)
MFGNQFFAHSFEIQEDRVRREDDDLLNCIIDIDHLVRYFREKHRVCWKEIYLKIASIIGEEYCYPFLCQDCRMWYNLPNIGRC